MKVVFDLEADGFLEDATQVWCWAAAALEDDKVPDMSWGTASNIGDLFALLHEADRIVGHNIIEYDLMLLYKLYGVQLDADKMFDTVIASRLFWPDLPSPKGWEGKPKPHSIEAWAMRFGGEQKVAIEQWEQYDPEMLERCKGDVRITLKLYDRIRQEMNK